MLVEHLILNQNGGLGLYEGALAIIQGTLDLLDL